MTKPIEWISISGHIVYVRHNNWMGIFSSNVHSVIDEFWRAKNVCIMWCNLVLNGEFLTKWSYPIGKRALAGVSAMSLILLDHP